VLVTMELLEQDKMVVLEVSPQLEVEMEEEAE